MIAFISWSTYIGGLYLLSSLLFRLRKGRWPMAYKFPPKDLYNLTDMCISSTLWIYTVWLGVDVLFRGVMPRPLGLLGAAAVPVGLAIVIAGFVLRLSTLIVLGSHWRMGIDPNEKQTEFVARGPYKYLKHPMNLGLVIVAFGQCFLTGFEGRAIFLLVMATGYYLIQGVAETRYWKERQESDRPAVTVWGTVGKKRHRARGAVGAGSAVGTGAAATTVEGKPEPAFNAVAEGPASGGR